ncbi:MAG: protein kinase domain-containing protein, partial [Planctomycetota bacterium]
MGENAADIYYLRDRWLQGPITRDELRTLLDAGGVNDKAPTWEPGQQGWVTPSQQLLASDETTELPQGEPPARAPEESAQWPGLPSPRNLLALRLASEQDLVTGVQKERLLNLLFLSPDAGFGLLADLRDKGWITEGQRATLETALDRGLTSQLIGDYEIIRGLGPGGMGMTYLARQLSLDRQVALKVLLPRFSQNEEYIKRFEREAKVAAMMNHENIASAYDVGKAAGQHYFVMEYVEGRTVGELIEEMGQLPEEQAVSIVAQTCRALAHAQEHGLIHRDVKPDNIIVKPNGRAKLIDMGLARSTGPDATKLTGTGFAPCTPDFVSPEQAQARKDIDIRSDIYSLGCVLYAMLTGTVPFEGSNAIETVNMHISNPLPSVRDRRPDASDLVCRVVGRMTAKRPEDRYQTPEEVIADLAEAAGTAAPTTTVRPVSEQLEAWKRGTSVEVVLLPDMREYTHLVAAELDDHLDRAGATPEFKGGALTVLADLVANAFDHGCGDVSEGVVRIRMELNAAFFSLEVEDPGPGFEVEETLARLAKEPPGRTRGRGMVQVYNTADAVTYSRKGSSVKAVIYRKRKGSAVFTEERGGITFVDVKGSDLALVGSFERTVGRYATGPARRVCLLVRTTYVPSRFVGAIVKFHETLEESGSALSVWVEHRHCYDSIESLGITEIVPI